MSDRLNAPWTKTIAGWAVVAAVATCEPDPVVVKAWPREA